MSYLVYKRVFKPDEKSRLVVDMWMPKLEAKEHADVGTKNKNKKGSNKKDSKKKLKF